MLLRFSDKEKLQSPRDAVFYCSASGIADKTVHQPKLNHRNSISPLLAGCQRLPRRFCSNALSPLLFHVKHNFQ